MISDPIIVERAAVPYVAAAARLRLDAVDAAAPDLFGRVFGFAAAHGLAVAGAPFLKHNVIAESDGACILDLEFGLPLATSAEAAAAVGLVAGALPAGRYGSVTQRGPYGSGADGDDALLRANAALIAWGERTGQRWDCVVTPEGDVFGCRLEIYHVGPHREADAARWETEVAIRLADG